MVAPLELLENRLDRKPTFMGSIFNPFAAALTGLGCALFLNFAFKKPAWSGLQKHILLTAAGGGIGAYVDKKRDQHMADRDAVLRHYVELHPDDFPTPERKKYADVLEAWAPIR